MMLRNICEVLDPVALRQSRISHVRQYIPPDSMRTFSRRRYRAPPLPIMELPAKPARPSKRSALFTATRSALVHGHQASPHQINTNREGAQNSEQHEEGGCDICRECETRQCDCGIVERHCIVRVMGGPSLRKSHGKGRNYARVSDELVKKKNGSDPYCQRPGGG